MIIIELPLVTGINATLFLGAGNFTITESLGNNNQCFITDGTHNNSSWSINKPYKFVRDLIAYKIENEQKPQDR